MTREECKDFLVQYVEKMGGIRRDQLVSAYEIYVTPGVSEVFHPDMLDQLMVEKKLAELGYVLGTVKVSYLIPVNAKVNLTNVQLQS